MGKIREFWVGLFAIIAIVAFVLITISLGKFDFFSEDVNYFVKFKTVSQLESGASVLVHGVKKGYVANIESLPGAYPVLVTLKLKEDVQLYPDASIAVSTPGVIGSATVNIDSGTPQSGDAARPETMFVGEDSLELKALVDDLSGDVKDVMTELKGTLSAANKILSDEQTQTAFKETLGNLASVSREANTSFIQINEQLEPTLAELREAIREVRDLASEGRGLVGKSSEGIDSVKTSASDAARAWEESGQALEAELETISKQLQALLGQLNTVVETNTQPVNASVMELHDVLASLATILQRLERGEGSVGQLLENPEPFERLNRTLGTIDRTLTGSQPEAFPLELNEPATAQEPEGE